MNNLYATPAQLINWGLIGAMRYAGTHRTYDVHKLFQMRKSLRLGWVFHRNWRGNDSTLLKEWWKEL